VLNLTPLQAGLWTVPWALAFVVGSMLTPVLVGRFAPATVVTGGLVLSAFGFAAFAQPFIALNLTLILIGTITMSLGLAAVFTLATDLVVGSAPPERAGAASALSETSSEFGGAMGIAVLGSIGSAVYRSKMSGTSTADLPPESMEAARGSLGGALAVSEHLPGHVADGLAALGRGAFADGLQVVSLIATVTMVVTALLFMMALRPGGGLRSVPSEA
jgi:DHA2 family multidrug resistance protein-like MFS transporter